MINALARGEGAIDRVTRTVIERDLNSIVESALSRMARGNMRKILYSTHHKQVVKIVSRRRARAFVALAILVSLWFAVVIAAGAAPRTSDAKLSLSGSAKAKSATVPKVDSAAPNGKSGMWWARENGWGISLTSSADNTKLFAAFYIYDDQGNARWYTASDCRFAGNQCTSRLEETSGSPCATPFSPGQVTRKDVGTLTLDFSSSAFANMSFDIGGVKRSVPVERFVFTSGAAPATDYSGVWWNPNESGNGVSITHLANTVFVAWYAFDTVGKATWYVLTCNTGGGNSCSETLYSASGPAIGPSFDISRVQLKNIGPATLTFNSNGGARLSYVASGQTITKDFVRFVF
jgi:hypothetical protein